MYILCCQVFCYINYIINIKEYVGEQSIRVNGNDNGYRLCLPMAMIMVIVCIWCVSGVCVWCVSFVCREC